MKLKTKVFTTIIVLNIIPIILAIVSVYLISNYQTMKLQSQYKIDTLTTTQSIINPIIIFDWLTNSTYKTLEDESLNDPEKFLDTKFLTTINNDMDSSFSFLVIRINDDFTYIGNNDVFSKIEKNRFPNYKGLLSDSQNTANDSISNADDIEDDEEDFYSPVYIGGSFPCLLKQQDFLLKDGRTGSAFIVININEVLPEVRTLAIRCVCVVIFIFLITSIFLIRWIYTSVLKPLTELRQATKNISGGNLDFTVSYKKDDELGDLCNDFEHMRVQLKELLENQALYETESRELISNISHDLKTPLTAIKGYSEGLIDGVADTPEKQRKYLKTIFNKANAMTALVDELSLYSKVEANNVMYDFTSINIDNYFSDCVEELTFDVEVKGIKLEYINNCNKNINVIIDSQQLKRVINNVVNNAIKYIGNKTSGTIKVILEDLGDFVQVEIKDNGKGISEDDINLIFDRFYRTDSSRNSAQGGTGLGLSISKKIIEDHNGKIYATSKEGYGTSIIFTLAKENLQLEEDTNIFKTSKYSFKLSNFFKKGN